MTKKQKESSTALQLAPSRLMSSRTTALSKAEKKMVALERKRMLGIAIQTRLACAANSGMSQIEMEMIEEFAQVALHHADIEAATEGTLYHSHVQKFIRESLQLTAQAFQTIADVSGAGITDIIAGPVLIEDEPEGLLARLFGGQ